MKGDKMRQKMTEDARASVKGKILDASKAIIRNKGLEGLSIRAVAKSVGFTPGSIYQYFDHKEALLFALLEEGYQILLDAALEDIKTESFEMMIIGKFTNYIKAALTMPDLYQTMMMSQHPVVLNKTEVLRKETKALVYLNQLLEKGYEQDEFNDADFKALGKALWISHYGLTLRLITEQIKDEAVIEELVKEQVGFLLKGIRN